MTDQTPAGWYPQADGTQRYWDGAQWTEHTAPGSTAPRSGGSPKWLIPLVALGALIAMGLVVGAIAGAGDDDGNAADTTDAPDTTTTEGEPALPTSGCDDAFAQAADVDDMSDTVEDLHPAALACESLDDWLAGSDAHPDALDGADATLFAENMCRSGTTVEPALADAPVCQEVG